jgi:cyanoexosortase B-associated protein
MLARFNASPQSIGYKRLIVLFALTIALTTVIPGYLHQSWMWQQIPPVRQAALLKTLQQKGLSLPGWQTLEQQTVEIGGHKWSAQAIVPQDQATTTPIEKAVWLLLRPQVWERDLPQIDWTDVNGVRQWNTDSQQMLRFTVPSIQSSEPVSVQARFLRGWTSNRTDAVLQWYAWSTGGHFAPSHWFWADQLTQLLHRQRLVWVAVSIQLPIQPLGEIEIAQAEAEALGQRVQSTLMTTVFKE